jgi:hypothetical protein
MKVHRHLVQVFGELTMAYSTVTVTVSQFGWAVTKKDTRGFSGRPPSQAVGVRIRRVLDEIPGTSIHQIVNETEIPASTVW